MCSCEEKNILKLKNSEISKDFQEDNSQPDNLKFQSRNKYSKYSLQNSGKITQFISPDKMDENDEENNLFNSVKNAVPSNNVVLNKNGIQNISLLIESPIESIQIGNNNYSEIIKDDNKVDQKFCQISKIEENKSDKKILYNNSSRNSLNKFIEIFKNDSLLNNNVKNKFELNGEGILKLNNGKSIEGKLINKKLNGFSRFIDEDGTIYEGVFENGELKGIGKIIKMKENNNEKSINQTQKKEYQIIYTGNIKNFKKEGFGKEECFDYIYKGNFHNNMKNGKGEIKMIKSGDNYEGEFVNDKITGYGKYIWDNHHQYIGYFVNGEMNGKGKYKWPDGSEYEGEYVNNKREGKGKFKWNSGAFFEGNFHNGKPDGKGIFFKQGSTYNAEFKDGHLKIHRKIRSKLI